VAVRTFFKRVSERKGCAAALTRPAGARLSQRARI
jgi:hypothetical protein